MQRPLTRPALIRLLLAVVLMAAQSAALAHGVDEASHHAQTVCDLCVAGHALGSAAAGGELHWTANPSRDDTPATSSADVPLSPPLGPLPRAPPVSC